MDVVVVGGGLAGCEASWQLATRGVRVRLMEMKPARRSPAHGSDELGELVCSNSLGSNLETTAAGLLKAELRAAGSLVMSCADASTVPAGGALAVDRGLFARRVDGAVRDHERIRVEETEVSAVPDGDLVIMATGPMTAPPLSDDLLEVLADGDGGLHYWDAISPIVEADSVDGSRSFAASRWGRGESEDGDYVNCPMDEAEYREFVEGVIAAEKVALRDFEEPSYYEGCLPVEVLASRGPDTLAFGPLRPAGLADPSTGKRPFAVLQLRREDRQGRALNLVGCQTRMTRPEQRRVFRMVPALENARFVRYGQVHRNTFVDAPRLLEGFMESRIRKGLFVAGQLCGVEGYTESTAAGLLASLAVWRRIRGGPDPSRPPASTACGGLMNHVQGLAGSAFQPSGISWALVQMSARRKGQRKHEHRKASFMQGLGDFRTWLQEESFV